MSNLEEVVILDLWVSPFCMRVKIALAEKGVEYEARAEEDLFGAKSDLLLTSNPIHKKVPVLLHNGKPLCESTIIVSYIDQTWPSPPLLPTSPYDRAQALFWADFIDKKLFEAMYNICTFKEEVPETANKDFIQILKHLEGALGEKDFFGGDSFGFLDIILIPLTSWFYPTEKFGGFQVKEECPKLSPWINRCMERQTVAAVLPDPEKVYEFAIVMRKIDGVILK